MPDHQPETPVTQKRVASTMVYLPGVHPTTINRMKSEMPSTRCTATSKSTGTRCQKQAVTGTTVCEVHGAARGTPAREKADRLVASAIRKRLDEAAENAMSFIEDILTDDGADDRTRLQASRDVLDRAGYVAIRKQEIEVHNPSERSVDDDIDELVQRGRSQAS